MFRLEFRPLWAREIQKPKTHFENTPFLKREFHMEISTDPDKAVFSFNYNAGYDVCT